MKNITYTHPRGFTVWADILTRDELKAGWADIHAQGNRQARERGSYCVVVPCEDIEDALFMSAIVYRCFAIKSCCHWDGKTLSMYCGDAGIGANNLYSRITKRMIGEGYLPDPMPGPPFAED